jgi:hypothetical protein
VLATGFFDVKHIISAGTQVGDSRQVKQDWTNSRRRLFRSSVQVGPRLLAAVIAVFRSEFKGRNLVAVSARVVVSVQGNLWIQSRAGNPKLRPEEPRRLCVCSPLGRVWLLIRHTQDN